MPTGLVYSTQDIHSPLLTTINGESQPTQVGDDAVQRILSKPSKASGLLRRRRGSVSLYMKMPCVEKQTNPFTVLEDRFEILEKLGSGAGGMVHRAIRKDTGHQVALKVPRDNESGRVTASQREYELLKGLAHHPNIIQAFDFHNSNGEATIELEFFEGVSLQAAVQQEVFAESVARSLCISLFSAVAHLHAAHILHRDIKPENVLVSKCCKDLKLIDFNVASCLTDGVPLTPTGTELYKAPELLSGEPATERSDVWASSLCVFFMLVGRLPYGRSADSFSGDDSTESSLFQSSGWTNISESCKAMLNMGLDRDCEARPTMSELLEHPWVVEDADSVGAISLSMLELVVPDLDAYLDASISVVSSVLGMDKGCAIKPQSMLSGSCTPEEEYPHQRVLLSQAGIIAGNVDGKVSERPAGLSRRRQRRSTVS